MRQLLLTLTTLFALNTFLSAQSFDFPVVETHVFAVPASTVDSLVSGTLTAEKMPALGTPYPAGTKTAKLPPGHYLRVSLSEVEVTYEYFSTYQYEVQVAENKGKFQLKLYDPAGQPQADARVTADGKPVRYDQKHQAYRRRDWRIDDLKIIVGTDTLFYTIREGIDKSRFANDLRHVSRNRPVAYLLTPYYFVRSTVNYAKRGFGYGDWAIRSYPFRRPIHNLLHPPKPVTGYVSTNQPKYRPGYTLKISAYLAKPKGRPLHGDSITLKILQSSPYQTVLYRKIGRAEKGRYTLEMPIPAGWTLDKEYTVSFDLPGIMRRNVAPQISFRLEDYELAEYQLAVTASKETQLPGSAWLDVSTKDINGLSLPDGAIRVTVLLEQFLASVDSTTLVLPDTLYTHVEATDDRLERRIILPDSLFPAGHSVRVRVKTQLTGPSGEYKEEATVMTADRRFPHIPRMTVDEDSLRLFLAPAFAPSPREASDPDEAVPDLGTAPENALLQTIDARNDTTTLSVVLPHTRKIDHQMVAYRLLYGAQTVSQELSELMPVNGSPVSWSRDTLRLSFPNAGEQPLFWEIWAGSRDPASLRRDRALHFVEARTQVLASGDEASPAWRQSGFAPGTELTLRYRYLAGGNWVYAENNVATPRYDLLTADPQVLQLTLTQPAKVRPGETVRVALRATDQQGRPAPGLRLTAGSYNARFEDTPTTTPTYVTKSRRQRTRQSYSLQDAPTHYRGTSPFWLLQSLVIDTALAYQLRFPAPEFQYRRSLDTLIPKRDQQAHFAPFIVKNHRPETVRMVYADDRLVYWYHPNITTPYSIPLDSGWHEIVLRTNDFSYTKKLYFPAREQLIISFDAERWVAAGWRGKKLKKPTPEEINTLYKQVFAVMQMNASHDFQFRAGAAGVVQSGRSGRYSRWLPLGLALPGQYLDFWLPGEDSVNFVFEPYAAYRVSTGRDRLYPFEKQWIADFQEEKQTNGPEGPGLPRYAFEQVVIPQYKHYFSHTERLPRLVPGELIARVQFTNLPKDLKKVVLAPVDLNAYYLAQNYAPNHVPAGDYDLLYHLANDSVLHQRIHLPQDSLTLVAYQRDSLRYFNDFGPATGYLGTRPVKETEEIVYREYYFNGDFINGTVRDENGEPLIGATILIEGTRTGTVSDFDGRFTLEVPTETAKLLIHYTGFVTQEITVSPTSLSISDLEITLEASYELLEEVVVVGYNTVSKQNLTASVTVVQSLEGRAAGASVEREENALKIRGSRSDAVDYYVDGVPGAMPAITIRGLSSLGMNNPLYIVDGVVYTDIKDVPQQGITNVEVIKDDSAVALYGARAANGVVIITTDKRAADEIAGLAFGDLPAANLRSSFSDYAAFVPELRTDQRGEAVFDITFPDDITAWNTFAVGQDRRRRVGFALEQTNAFLPLQAQLYLPRFLVEGDRSEASALAINREGKAQNVRLQFSGDGVLARTQDTMIVNSVVQSYPIQAGVAVDSMSFQFSLRALPTRSADESGLAAASAGERISDGEARTLPVYPKGTEMVSGELLLLTERTTVLPDSFVRPERGPVTLRLPGNRLAQLLADVNHLVGYPYGCAEQTASRLIGLLAVKEIREAEGNVFGQEGNVEKMIDRLEKLLRADGGFGWWEGSEVSSPWISLHVYEALSRAASGGFAVADLTPTRRYLLATAPTLPHRDQLQISLALAEDGHPPTQREMDVLDTLSAPNDYQLLAITRLHQLRGDTVDVQRLLDSSSLHSVIGRYWGDRRFRFYRQPLADRLACGLLAQRILSAAGRETEAAETVNYLLGQTASTNQPGSEPLLGTNTLESAKLVAGLLPYLLEQDGKLKPPSVSIATSQRVALAEVFPFEVELSPAELPSLRLERSGSGPLPVSLFQRWFERAPTETSAGFSLTARLTDARTRGLAQLTKGETAWLEVTVTNPADADYVLIEIPVPAGCSYHDRSEARGPYAVHREYRRDRVAIFCDRLPAGTHTYKIALAPRFSGDYALNPARAEMQYVPVVNGNGELGRVRVE